MVWIGRRSEAAAAHRRLMATSEASTAVTAHPARARHSAFRPRPHAKSRAVPGGCLRATSAMRATGSPGDELAWACRSFQRRIRSEVINRPIKRKSPHPKRVWALMLLGERDLFSVRAALQCRTLVLVAAFIFLVLVVAVHGGSGARSLAQARTVQILIVNLAAIVHGHQASLHVVKF